MKRIIILFGLLLLFTSCKTTMYNHKVECEMSKKNLFDGLSGLLIEKGFEIKTANPEIGMFHANTLPEFNVWNGANISKVWIIKVSNNNEVTAMAKVTSATQNAFGATTASSETYLGDKTSTDEDWYWDVRSMLEDLCKSKITIIETQK